MKTVFLSAPYAGDITKNIAIAKRAARLLRDQGFNVFLPHTAIAGYCDDWTDTDPEHRNSILAMCVQWVGICDYFAQVPGWDKSDGCCLEYAYASAAGKEMIALTWGDLD